MSEPKQTYQDVDEITLKELILKLKDFYKEALKNFLLLAIAGGLLAAILLARALWTPATYSAKMTFMVNEDEGGGATGMGSILGQFGFGGGGGEYNLAKITELTRSGKIINTALFEKGIVGGKEDYYANHLIRVYELHDKWKKDTTGLADFLFTRSDFAQFSRPENKALKRIYKMVKGSPESKKEPILSMGYTEETGILEMGINSTSEEVSLGLLKEIYEKLSTFYIFESTEKQKQTYKSLKAKADSLKAVLEDKEYQLARTTDSNLGLIGNTARLKRDRLSREVQGLALAYAKTYENLEVADFSLKNATPFFQVIDWPLTPVSPKRASKVRAILLGGFLGGFFCLCFIIGRKIVRDAMSNE